MTTHKCPWCSAPLDRVLVRDLIHIARAAPCCGKPISSSMWQVVFTVLAVMPLIAPIVYCSMIAEAAGHRTGAIVVLVLGGGLTIYVQKYLPVVHGPVKGPGQR